MRQLLVPLLSLLVVAGCSPTLYVYTPDAKTHRILLRDAGRQVGLRVKTVDQLGDGALEVQFYAHDAGVCGAALEKVVGYPEHFTPETVQALIDAAKDKNAIAAAKLIVDCTPRAWACTGSPHWLGHEIGHVLGLRHKEGTFMDAEPVGTEPVTDLQGADMKLVALGFTYVCGVPTGNVSDPLEPQ